MARSNGSCQSPWRAHQWPAEQGMRFAIVGLQ